MEKLLIKSAKCDILGPLEETVVAEVELSSETQESFFVSLAEVEGVPLFFKTDVSKFDVLMGESDNEQPEDLSEYSLFDGEYEELFEEQDDELMPLYRYLIFIVRSEWDECEDFIDNTVGKYLDEIEIPISDIEEDYIEENE